MYFAMALGALVEQFSPWFFRVGYLSLSYQYSCSVVI